MSRGRVYPNLPQSSANEPQIATVSLNSFTGNSAFAQNELLRKRGDDHAHGLQTQVSRIKEVSLQIQDEIRRGNAAAETLESRTEMVQAQLRKAMKALEQLRATASSRHYIWLALFVCGVFFLLWFMSKL